MLSVSKGHIAYFNSQLLVITSANILVWDFDRLALKRQINLPIDLEIEYLQVITRHAELFIIDLKNSKMIYLDVTLQIHNILIPKIAIPWASYVISLNKDEILFNGSLEPFLFNKKDLSFTKYSYLLISKHNLHFRRIRLTVSNFDHNILYSTENSEQLLYHQYYRDYNSNYLEVFKETRISNIGVYITNNESKITEFESPDKVKCINWFTQESDAFTSNVKGLLIQDKIILCYHEILYILDSNKGTILAERAVSSGTRYFAIEKLNNKQIFISEEDKANTTKMNISIFDV